MNNDLISRKNIIKLIRKKYKLENPITKHGTFIMFDLIRDIENMETANTERSRENKTPCDLCMYDPPSSFGGKPCSMCPACAKMGGSEE